MVSVPKSKRAVLRASIAWLLFALGSAWLFALDPSAALAARPPRAITIAEARQLPLGTRVTLEGTVSTPSGAFTSSFFDVGFGVQDRTAGIYVSLQEDLDLSVQDHVRVTGVLADSFGLLILLPDSAADVESCGHAAKVKPRRLSTAAIGEATEGLLVSVKGVISQAPSSDLPYGYKFSVNDGSGQVQIFVNLESGVDVSSLTLGQKVSVTGFSSQFDDHYEIDPRSPDDVTTHR
jgi:uncharacterized protein YdeI (BOF family)